MRTHEHGWGLIVGLTALLAGLALAACGSTEVSRATPETSTAGGERAESPAVKAAPVAGTEPAASAGDTETGYFAGGCFWGVEHLLEDQPGVKDVVSGYMGGASKRPSYREVSEGDSGHIETVKVVFDPAVTTYEVLARRFFEIHDPTQVDRQGPDVGAQYRSAIFYASDAQRQVARKLIALLQDRGLKVATHVLPAGEFWDAEGYHQDYYARTQKAPYCHAYTPRFGDE